MKNNFSSIIFPSIIVFLAPLSIFISLVVLNNVPSTFFVFFFVVCFLLPLIDLWVMKNLRFEEIKKFLALSKLKQSLIPGFTIGIVFGIAIYFGFLFLRNLLISDDNIRSIFLEWGLNPSHTFLLIAVLIFINPIMEELLWRGYILQSFSNRLGTLPAVIISSLGYASYHLITTGFLFSWTAGIFLSLTVFFAGIFWSLWRISRDSVFGPIISHMLADSGIIAVYIYLHIANFIICSY